MKKTFQQQKRFKRLFKVFKRISDKIGLEYG